MLRGGRKKLATDHHRQTAPLPVKNDSSLIMMISLRWHSWTNNLAKKLLYQCGPACHHKWHAHRNASNICIRKPKYNVAGNFKIYIGFSMHHYDCSQDRHPRHDCHVTFTFREHPLTTGGGAENLGKIDLAFLAIPPIKRKWNFAIPPFRRGEIWW